MKVYKKILAVILAVTMVINCNIISFANEYQNNIDSDIVLMKDAEQIAVFHIKNVMAYKKGSMWEEGVRICCRKAIFDINNEIAAYYFGLEDSNKNPAGYIVVGGNKKSWINAMEDYLKDKESKWYNIPDNVVAVLIDPTTGNIATNKDKNKKIMYYLKGTEPIK